MKLKRLTSLIVTLSMIIPISCCKKQDGRERIVSEDTPWYESSINTYGIEFDGDVSTSMPLLLTPDYKIYYQYYDNSSDMPCNRLYYETLEKERIINLEDYGSFICCNSDKNALYVVVNNPRDGFLLESYNPSDEELIEIASLNSILEEGASVNKVLVKDNIYILYSYIINRSTYSGVIKLTSNGDVCYRYEAPEYISKFTICDDDTLVLFTEVDMGGNALARSIKYLSPEGETIDREITLEYIERYWNAFVLDDGCAYKQGLDAKLYKYDFSSDEEVVALDYNNCDANIDIISSSTIYYCDEDSIIFNKATFYSDETNVSNQVVELVKQSYNPHVGKTILYAAPLGDVSYLIGENIIDYNQNNDDTVIYITMDYSIYGDFLEMQSVYEASVESGYDKKKALLSNLIRDIENGDGPDILLGYGDYPILNNSDYLIPLNSIVATMDTREYFIDDSWVGSGDIYGIPLGVSVSGIYAKADERFCDGITYDDYEDFVELCCNGLDPIGNDYDRNDYLKVSFDMLYNSLHDNDGLLMIDNEEFVGLCSFVKGFPEIGVHSYGNAIGCINLTMFCDDLMYSPIHQGYTLYGLPSLEGSAPMMSFVDTISITSCCYSEDSAIEFVQNGLSYDMQVQSKGNPINVRAFDTIAEDSLPRINAFIEENIGISNYYDDSIVEIYKSILLSADVYAMHDDISFAILHEEIAPYYLDQKEINEIIPIVEDRANNEIKELV